MTSEQKCFQKKQVAAIADAAVVVVDIAFVVDIAVVDIDDAVDIAVVATVII